MRRGFEQTIEGWWQSQDPRPLLIRGARRTGKTYAAEEVGRRLAGDGFVKLDFQTGLDLIAPLFGGPTSDVDAIMSRVADYKRVRLSKETAFVLFDEVQLCERALNSLRFFSGSGWRICGTGSQLGVATRRRRLPFPSGVRQETMHPMTFEEFLWAMGEGQMADSIRSHALSLEPYPAHQGGAAARFAFTRLSAACPPPWPRTSRAGKKAIEPRTTCCLRCDFVREPSNCPGLTHFP